MLRNKNLSNRELIVSTTVHETGKLHLDESGFVKEELTPEATVKLLTNPEFQETEKPKKYGVDEDYDIEEFDEDEAEEYYLFTGPKEACEKYVAENKTPDVPPNYAVNKDWEIVENAEGVESLFVSDLPTCEQYVMDNKPKDDQENTTSPDAVTQESVVQEPKEGDTKLEDGKGYRYGKNKADKLQWLRASELDEKQE